MLRAAAIVLALSAALAGCTSDTKSATTSASSVATAAASSATTAAAATTTAASSSGKIDPAKGAQLTCSEWRHASHDQKIAATTVYLKSKGKPAEVSDATLAMIDIDVYCAGDQHPNDPIEPGFK